MRVVHRPAQDSVFLAMLPGVVAVIGLAINAVSLALAVAGLAVAGVGTTRARRPVVTGGTGLMYAGLLFAGINGGDPGIMLLATAGVVVCWTTAQHVVGLSQQLGREAPVRRSVVVHLAGTTIVTVVAGGLALVVFQVSGSGLPASGAVALVVGSLVLLYTLDPS